MNSQSTYNVEKNHIEDSSSNLSTIDTSVSQNNSFVTVSPYDDTLVSNSNVTIQGGSAILPRYDNCTITAINADLMLNGTQNSNANIYACTNAKINGAQNSYFNINGGNTIVSNSHNSTYVTNSDLSFNGGGDSNTIVTTDTATIWGNDGTNTLNLTLNAYNPAKPALFVAGDGNSTLNGAG